MQSKIKFLIMKCLNSSIRIYDIKQMMVSHKKQIFLGQRQSNILPTSDELDQNYFIWSMILNPAP